MSRSTPPGTEILSSTIKAKTKHEAGRKSDPGVDITSSSPQRLLDLGHDAARGSLRPVRGPSPP
jgi:hypothetical protein